MESVKLWITGRVQGVWYRATAKKRADELGVSGYIENEHDGSVYAEAEGEPDKVRSFIEWCKIGPQFASVSGVREESQNVQGFTTFEIRR